MASLLSGSSAMNAGAAVSATDKRKEQMASLTPRRVAIKFSPPTLILEYAPSYGRYLHYKVRMGHLRPSTDPYAVANRLYRDHPRFFDRAKVEFGQTLKLVRKLIDNAGAASPMASPVAPSPPPARAAPPPASYGDDFEDDFEPETPVVAAPAPAAAREEVDLNKVSEFRLKAAKLEMDVGFSQSLKRPGDAGYEYDKQVDFEPAGDSDGSWDD
ncbi:unnamed protein product [Pelagomonas calceolata]|uniref:Centrosomal protein of 19 kDa n=1 Tax=Pelagomonas calceolata TaxID=35677 RepID=A0A8J2S6R8_9STRA|nr:unnamed protein product [Pelagomonas calceolata]